MRNRFLLSTICSIAFIFLPFCASAEPIDINTYGYAWGENIGWIQFNPPLGGVETRDSEVLGYAWSELLGWISLNCKNNDSCGALSYGVQNDGDGNLSGYAWGENIGWINFRPAFGGVSIDIDSHEFSGLAWSEVTGWIDFDPDGVPGGYGVITDWPRLVPIEEEETVIEGYIWNAHLGWISLSCENEGVCETIPYGLRIEENGEISGYAWSPIENMGWICFGNTCTGTPPSGDKKAQFDAATSKVWGWAQVEKLGDNGWIRLRGDDVPVSSNYPVCNSCDEADASCGNLRVEVGEDCDDGKQCADGSSCIADTGCAGIGNGKCLPRNGGGCSETCLHEGSTGSAVCGNDSIELGEDCDNTPGCHPVSCLHTGSTAPAVCGDGSVDKNLGEDCDDGNIIDGDGCSSICLNEGASLENSCDICFKSSDYGGSSHACSDCSSCTLGTVNTCSECAECDQYGVALDRNTGQFKGWAWSGYDDGTGLGWFHFGPDIASIKFNWLETLYGDVYTKGFIKMPEESVTILNKYNATFCVQASGLITNFNSQSGCVQPGAMPMEVPKRSTGYSNVLGKIDIEGIITKVNGNLNKYGVAVETCDKFINGGTINLGGKVYYCGDNTDLAINNAIAIDNAHGSGLVVVDGNININKDVEYNNTPLLSTNSLRDLGSIGWMAIDYHENGKGNINIAANVEDLSGALYAEDTIDTGTTGSYLSDKQLTIHGLMVAHKFLFRRLYKSGTEGGERIIYDGKTIANVPPGMEELTKTLPLWEEVSP